MALSRVAARAAYASVWLWAASARADCDDGAGHRVELSFSGRCSPLFEQAVRADLEAGFSQGDVNVCISASSAVAPATAVQVECQRRELVPVHVQVPSAGGAKLLDRNVDLSKVPPDSRAFAVALAADELLHAAWAEQEVDAAESTPPAATPAPGAADARDALSGALPAPAPAPAARRWGVRAAFEAFQGGQTQLGADGVLVFPVSSRVALQLAPGVRRGLDVDAAHGTVSSRALSAASSLRYLALLQPLEVSVGVGLHGQWLELRGDANAAGTVAATFTGVALYSQAVVSAALRATGPLWLELAAGVGVPLVALEATDAGRAATAASGLQGAGSLALLLQL